MIRTLRLFLCIGLFATFNSNPGPQIGGQARIGFFPLRAAAALETDLATETLLTATTEMLAEELQNAGVGDIIMLSWPDELTPGDRPNFETLVGRGLEAGCTGVLALQFTEVSFALKTVEIPVLGTSQKAEARAALGGGLIDIATATAVAPVSAVGQATESKYDGPTPEEAVGDIEVLAESPLGKALAAVRKQVVAATKAGLGRLSAASSPPPARANAPEGVGFSRDQYRYDFVPGYDLRGIVAVVNRGSEEQAFIIKPLNSRPELTVGVMGAGSMDGPCTLRPGQWKYVRLVATARKAVENPEVKMGLYVAEPGKNPVTTGKPHDEATAVFNWLRSSAGAKFEVVGQDPATLAYKCRITNLSAEERVQLELEVTDENLAGLVRIEPRITGATLRPKASLTFHVIPELTFGMQPWDVALEGRAGGETLSQKFHFEIPPGKNVYYGLTCTGESDASDGEWCTNQHNFGIDVGRHYHTATGGIIAPDLDAAEPDTRPLTTRIGLKIGATWKRIMDLFPQRPDPQPQVRILTGWRGATIRPSVEARIGSLTAGATSHPMAGWGKGCAGLVWYVPAGSGKTAVCFAPVIWTGENKTDRPELTMLNDKTHSGRWPYVGLQPNGTRAFVVWEDSAPGRKTDVAFRASAPGMRQWEQVQYLTRHGAGVDDPVVHADERGNVAVAWGDLRSGTSQVFVRISGDRGASFAPEVAIPRASGETDVWPQFDFLPKGGFVMVYAANVGGQTRITARILNDKGLPAGEPAVLSHPGVACGEPQVACAGDGRLFAVWREGDGSDSEVWFASAPGPGQPWEAPLQITNDTAYSEYPLVWLVDSKVGVCYHSDISGLADIKYNRASADNGRTWSEAIAMPSLEEVAEQAWLEINFSLQWSRSIYRPHDTYICVNEVEVGRLENTVPEGTYVFPVPKEAIVCGASSGGANRVSIRVERMNGANYLAASKCRLIIGRRFTQLPVVAGSQAEANQLASRSGSNLNHNKPDLALAANPLSGLPDHVEQGQTIEVKLRVLNLGEAAATDVRVGLYSLDPRDPLVDRAKARLIEQQLGELKPGESREVKLAFKFDSKRTPRVYASAQGKEEDYWTDDNVWGISFTEGESRVLPPLLGTDIPNVFSAPQLLDLVNLPNIPLLQELLSLPSFTSLIKTPGIQPPDVNDLGGLLKRRLVRR